MQLKAFKNQNIEKKTNKNDTVWQEPCANNLFFFTILLLIYLKIFLVRTKTNIRFKNDEYSI